MTNDDTDVTNVDQSVDVPPLAELLNAAVEEIGGLAREGQQRMAELIGERLQARSGALLVQAGTGTGKSLAYLVPAAKVAVQSGEPVVIATATLALQRQLVAKDLPVVSQALAPGLGREIRFAVLKGRGNYLCRDRLERGSPDPDDQALFQAPLGRLARQAEAVQAWANSTTTGDRDDFPENVDGRVWAGVSVSAKECPGATNCAFGQQCFAEFARQRAREADVIVTNHAMLAIHVQSEMPVLPEHAGVVIDEAHELVDRMTTALTQELSGALVSRAVGRSSRFLDDADASALEDAGEYLQEVIESLPDGRISELPDELLVVLTSLRDAGLAALGQLRGQSADDVATASGRTAARAAIVAMYETSAEILLGGDDAVVWRSNRGSGPAVLFRAPIEVGKLLRRDLFAVGPVVLTSATMTLGGSFVPLAEAVGAEAGWVGVDVGSPFDHARQAILYCAAAIPRPGREGISDLALEHLSALIEAAGGRTLALFSSWRSVERAEEYLNMRFTGRADLPILAARRGDSLTPYVRDFAANERASLLGTLSLWQGVDVPGPSCTLVVIDRIPFPRPDDPVLSARQAKIQAAGGNGFAAISVPRAGLMLAQGAGRLIRSANDRGVVAILDSRLATQPYGATLRQSLPPLWWTTDPGVVMRALHRLDIAISQDSSVTP